MAKKIITACGGDVSGKTIAVLGLAFKPNTDDMRDAPSIDIITELHASGAIIKAYDPEAMKEAASIFKGLQNLTYMENGYDGIEGADALVIITEWDQFRAMDLDRIKAALAQPVVIDLRNIYRPDEMVKIGFQYISIGRPGAGPVA